MPIIAKIAKEFVSNHFEDFYLDAIRNKRGFDEYINKDRLFREHVEKGVDSNFVELTQRMSMLDKNVPTMDKSQITKKIIDDVYDDIKYEFTKELKLKLLEMHMDIPKDKDSEEFAKFESTCNKIIRCLNEIKKNPKERGYE